MAAGRWEDFRKPSEEELLVMGFLPMKIEKFSAKIILGPPRDNPGDLRLPQWFGVIPTSTEAGVPISSSQDSGIIKLPDYLKRTLRSNKRFEDDMKVHPIMIFRD